MHGIQPHPPARLSARQARSGGAWHPVLLGLPWLTGPDPRAIRARRAGRQCLHPQRAANRRGGRRLFGFRQRRLGPRDPFHYGGDSSDLAPARQSVGSAAGRCAQQTRLACDAFPALHAGPQGRGDGGLSGLLQWPRVPQRLPACLDPGARLRAGALSRACQRGRCEGFVPGRATGKSASEIPEGTGQGAETSDAMTQLSSGTLRLWAGADTLLIGHRAAFGHGRGLCRLDSEEEVRRRLIQALADARALDSLRAFWARHLFDTRRMTHTTDRALIDRVAQTTVRGPLAAYVVPDASVRHVHGSAMTKVMPLRPVQL